jgi:nucleoside-diphosphate-sugar epimerase
MKITVTGATGAVGPFVLDALSTDHDLTLFTRRSLQTPHAVVVGNILDPDACGKALAGAEAVVHLAGCPEPGPDTFRINTLGTFHLLEAARQKGVRRFIFASTNCVYGHCYPISQRPFPLAYLPIDESHPTIPEDNYGLSKMLCEQMLALYDRHWPLQTAALRLSWVWGTEEIHWRQEMEALDVARFAPYFWSYIDGGDVGRAVRLAVEAASLPAGGAYNITAADTMADEKTEYLIERFYPQAPLQDSLPGRASLFDCSRAAGAFGFRARHSWREAS